MRTGGWWGGLATGLALSTLGLAMAAQYDQLPSPSTLLTQTLARLDQYYVQPVDNAALTDKALSAMVSSLDRYSQYLRPDDIRSLEELADGHYDGLGLEVAFKDNKLLITQPLPGSPAAVAGLKKGDEIVKIDGHPVAGASLESLVKALRHGGKGQVELQVRRGEQLRHWTLSPGRVDVPSVSAQVLDGQRLWLRISQFQDSTASEVRRSLQQYHPQLAILDLRGNPGGVLQSAVAVADLFLDAGPIVSTQGRSDEANHQYLAHSGDPFERLPLLVLLDKQSASAAEILAGALQDRHRALVLGQTSFGKGTVQTLIPLAGGQRALKITTARYLTPSGRLIDGTGIMPDVAAGTVLADARQRSLLKSHYPLTRAAEVAREGQWADDALLWEAIKLTEKPSS
ncbi:S41 family peptidase [Gallaecimonas sp. GXIMD1310]|uniref:S41 family peptidase n=1 Tax=Gallaecimonas sp. GXIMD1310 TaxID=3131926 RepID=UPI00324E82EB